MKIVLIFFLLTSICFESISQEVDNYDDFQKTIEGSLNPSMLSGTRFFDYHSGIKKPFLFNGNFNYGFTIFGKQKKSFIHLLQFNPEINIRIFQNDVAYFDKSKPVRTPSYIPKISYYFSNSKLWDTNKKSSLFFGVKALHHSNGQDGWEFDYTDSVVNIYNGSFSESLFFQILIGGKTKLINNENNLVYFIWKSGFEWHPVYFSNEKFHKFGLYGGNRLLFNSFFQFKKRNDFLTQIEKFRIQLNAEYISDVSFYKGNLKHSEKIKLNEFDKRLNLSLSGFYNLTKLNHIAVFCQLAYFGSDNYNIYFQQSMFVARLGLAFGNFY
jgi:hypothetical protein